MVYSFEKKWLKDNTLYIIIPEMNTPTYAKYEQLKTLLDTNLIGNDINIADMIISYITYECDCGDVFVNTPKKRRNQCYICYKEIFLCPRCIKSNTCDECNDKCCEKCAEDFMFCCEYKKCPTINCEDCRSDGMVWTDCCGWICCKKVYRCNREYQCEDCVDISFPKNYRKKHGYN
jgi:hypothetical protein